MRSLLVSIVALGLLAQAVQAQSLPIVEKVATAGKAQQIGRIISVDPDCQPIALPTVSVLEGPRQGQVTTATGQDFPTFSPMNPRAKCNTQKAPSLGIVYAAPTGATGDDLFTLEFVDQLGNPQRVRYHITIR